MTEQPWAGGRNPVGIHRGGGGWRRRSPDRIWHGDYKFAQARIQPAVRWGNNGVTKVFGGTPNTARETRTLPFGRTAAVLTAARGQARWRHRANGCRRAGQTGREMRYDGCPRACAARCTLGYNLAGFQPLGGARLSQPQRVARPGGGGVCAHRIGETAGA